MRNKVKKRLISFNEEVSQAIDEFVKSHWNLHYRNKGIVSDMVNQAVIDYLNQFEGMELRIRGLKYVDEDGKHQYAPWR